MNLSEPGSFTVFFEGQLMAQGTVAEIARAISSRPAESLLIIDDATGRSVDFDLRGSPNETADPTEPVAQVARGRPRLGVVAREITLLPRHWDWLATQPGGASATIRRLVDAARRDNAEADAARKAREAAYGAMTILAGDSPGYEEAARALFSGHAERFANLIADWPPDVRDYLLRLTAKIDASAA